MREYIDFTLFARQDELIAAWTTLVIKHALFITVSLSCQAYKSINQVLKLKKKTLKEIRNWDSILFMNCEFICSAQQIFFEGLNGDQDGTFKLRHGVSMSYSTHPPVISKLWVPFFKEIIKSGGSRRGRHFFFGATFRFFWITAGFVTVKTKLDF